MFSRGKQVLLPLPSQKSPQFLMIQGIAGFFMCSFSCCDLWIKRDKKGLFNTIRCVKRGVKFSLAYKNRKKNLQPRSSATLRDCNVLSKIYAGLISSIFTFCIFWHIISLCPFVNEPAIYHSKTALHTC